MTAAVEPLRTLTLRETGTAERGTRPEEVVVALSPAFGDPFTARLLLFVGAHG